MNLQLPGKLLALLLLVIFTNSARAQPELSREYNIKAVFLLNFTRFIDWPAEAYQSAASPFVIGILGNDPFNELIDNAVAGEVVYQHPIVIQRYKSVDSIKDCHVLFIARTEAADLKSVQAALTGKSTLTVSDQVNFAGRGGMICFVTQNNKIKLQINALAAKRANLNISSKLLRLAEIVEPQ